ncbi:MAG: cob(I)yrinic acid a,c-diamide adenosyltransferase [Pseudomonadota bacterium]|nr:cob(I)yrinic acid a,c-diamide adenosyltransferase [Pseudomonadota bacterium]
MTDKSERHTTRMAKKKAVIDAAIAGADKEKGLLLVLTGNGKGKSSSAFGMVARALGHGMKVGVAQFIKGRSATGAGPSQAGGCTPSGGSERSERGGCPLTGEEAFLGQQPGVEWHVLGEGFTWDTQNLERDIATAKQGWEVARRLLADPAIQLVVLDELTYLLNYGWLDVDAVLADLAARPPMQHVVVTGRAASQALIDAADTVSEIADVKHAYRAGVKAQAGVDL